MDRVKFIKAKTDSFLFAHFQKKIVSKFQFEFSGCGYVRGEMRSVYQFLNSDNPEPSDINNLTHNYSFFDKEINLTTDIDIYYNQDQNIELRFQTLEDSLRYEALSNIYKRGLLNRIKAKAKEAKFKNAYVRIEVDKIRNTFNIILKDKVLPHTFFIT